MPVVRDNSLESEHLQGLSSVEAGDRLEQDGYNELPSAPQHSTVIIALGVVQELMFLLLIASVTIYLTLGDLREAIVLALSLLIILGITIFQERKTERAGDAT